MFILRILHIYALIMCLFNYELWVVFHWYTDTLTHTLLKIHADTNTLNSYQYEILVSVWVCGNTGNGVNKHLLSVLWLYFSPLRCDDLPVSKLNNVALRIIFLFFLCVCKNSFRVPSFKLILIGMQLLKEIRYFSGHFLLSDLSENFFLSELIVNYDLIQKMQHIFCCIYWKLNQRIFEHTFAIFFSEPSLWCKFQFQ